MTTFLSIFLMGPPQGGAQGGGGLGTLLPMLGMMALVFYFFMIRPQTKKAKEAKLFREGIKKGDKIVTIGGVHGKIAEISDATVIIETEGGGKLKIDKTAISQEASVALNKAS